MSLAKRLMHFGIVSKDTALIIPLRPTIRSLFTRSYEDEPWRICKEAITRAFPRQPDFEKVAFAIIWPFRMVLMTGGFNILG